jgi:tRNA (mo5U34)-methyltransferase
MTQSPTWLRKERTVRAGPLVVSVSMPVVVAERVRSSAVYRRVVKPALTRRGSSSLASAPPAPPRGELDAEARALLARINEVDWYHSIDLGHGVVTPGLVDHRAQVPLYGLPDSLAGMRVLDVATFDGFWAFEFERRGAQVVALDIASWSDVDMPQCMRPYLAEFELDGTTGSAFALARQLLGSTVRRVEGSVYDLDPEWIGTFDLVFISDLLLHLRCPQRAIESAASVCRGQLVVADVFTPMLEGFGDLALAQYTAPSHTWWLPNVKTLSRMMAVAGCESVDEVSRFVLDWAVDSPMHKVVLRGQMATDPMWLREYREWASATSPKWKSAAEQPA